MAWTVKYRGQAKKSMKQGSKILTVEAREAMDALYLELEFSGPTQSGWPNYSKLKGPKKFDKRHCHLIKGKPTYVACWEVIDKTKKVMEIYYVGTHEKAPY